MPSHGEASRIDYLLANPAALSIVEGVSLRWDLGFATHAALMVEFRAEEPEQALIRQPVQRLHGAAVEGWGPAAAQAATSAVQAAHGEAFRQALARHDVEAAWLALHAAMRGWLATGLGLPATPDRPHAAAAWQADRPPTAGGGGEAADRHADATLLRLRRLRALQHAQRRAAGSTAAWTVAESTLTALRAADGATADWAEDLAALSEAVELPARLLERAEVAWKEARASARGRRREEWRKWVQGCLANGQGRLYRWIRGGASLDAELVPVPAAALGGPAPAAGTRSWLLALRGGPAAQLRFFEGPWRAIWQRQAAPPLGEEWLQELDGLPAFPERVPWTAELVGWLLRQMPKRKKPGLDHWTVGELRLLPNELHGWIADLFEEVEESGRWPQDLAEAEGLLLPKPGGEGGPLDRRPIWLLSTLYRLWAAGRARLFARWRLSWAGEDVQRGAEELAWDLALELEAAEALGETLAGAALDWRKAYDHIDLGTLPGVLARAGVPQWIIGPAMGAYTANRRLRVGRAIGGAWAPSSGILPGCALAVFFLSVLTWPWHRRTGAVDDRLQRRIYVDDFTLWSRRPVQEAGEAAESVRDALRVTAAFEHAMGWQLNRGKSVHFANSAAVRRWLSAQALGISAGTSFKDLGVVATAGRRRRCAVAPSRLLTAAGRFARIGRLPVDFRQRCLLGAAAGTAAGMFGAACGLPPARELAGLRAAARHAVCKGGFRAAAEVVFGVLSPSWRLDPAAITVIAPLWQIAKALRRGRFPEDLWREAEGAIAAGHGRRQGPIAAAARSMAALQLGANVACWQGVPSAPAGWRPAGQALQDTRAVLLAAWARREAREVAIRRADFAHVAGGMDRWATRRLLESGELAPDAAGALRAVLSGNVVTETVAAKWGKPERCPHCGAAREDRQHRFWDCPCWSPARRAALAAGGFSAAALLARLPPGVANSGVLPLDPQLAAEAAMASVPLPAPPMPDPAAVLPDQPQRCRAWTDGACEHPTDPLLARAGWGFQLERPAAHGATRTEHCGPVDGLQTAQRAELTAALRAVSEAGQPVEVITDSKFVANGIAAIRQGASARDWAHADLWERLAPHCRTRFVIARWVKGHLDEDGAAARGVTAEDRHGNAAADRLAGTAAKARLPAAALLQRRLVQLSALRVLQSMLAAVELEALKANHGCRGPEGPRVRRRWGGPPRRRAPRVADDAAVAAAVAQQGRQGGVGVAPRPGPAAAARALFGGGAWRAHAASQGPNWVACLRCGCWAPDLARLTSRPCAGWVPILPPKAAALMLLPPARAGGDEAAWRRVLGQRLAARPGPPD